jgi:hypothetical protein
VEREGGGCGGCKTEVNRRRRRNEKRGTKKKKKKKCVCILFLWRFDDVALLSYASLYPSFFTFLSIMFLLA